MSFSILIGVLLSLVAAQQNSQDPNVDFCRRYQHQTCVIDSKLYVDGGLVYYGPSVTSTSQPERSEVTTTPLCLELILTVYRYLAAVGRPFQSLSRNSSAVQQLNKGRYDLRLLISTNLGQGAEVPTVHNGVLWPDEVNKLFYLFGGAYADGKVPSVNDLWSYDTIYNNWTKITPDGSQMSIKWPNSGASDVTDEGDAYYYGGYLSNISTAGWTGDTIMLSSLVKYDTKTNKWDNRTYDNTPRAEGNLHYIPASKRGMLIYFGGLEQTRAGNINYVCKPQTTHNLGLLIYTGINEGKEKSAANRLG